MAETRARWWTQAINQGGSVITSNTGALSFDKRFVILFFSFMRTLRTTCRYLSAIIWKNPIFTCGSYFFVTKLALKWTHSSEKIASSLKVCWYFLPPVKLNNLMLLPNDILYTFFKFRSHRVKTKNLWQKDRTQFLFLVGSTNMCKRPCVVWLVL